MVIGEIKRKNISKKQTIPIVVRIICRCEDVTYEDILAIIEKGYTDIEEIRRYLRCGMGVCQGRTCMRLVKQILNEKGIKDVKLPKSRPPTKPVSVNAMCKKHTDKDEK